MSYYDRNSSAQKPPRRRAAAAPATKAVSWTNKRLDNGQKAKLSIAARVAWDIQSQAGLVDGKFDDWRHAETKVACGLESLREATNAHFRSILAHFFRLAGKIAEADAVWAKTGRVAGSTQVHDTHENREVARALIRDLVTGSNGRLHPAYVAAIARGKFGNEDLLALTAKDLQDLLFTLRARLRKLPSGHE